MTYEEVEHEVLVPGQRWTCKPSSGEGVESVLVVAVDSSPAGIVVNVVIERPHGPGESTNILAPIQWESLEPSLQDVTGGGVDVSAHFDSYQEWKQLAEQGKAGVWTCGLGRIVETICSVTNG